MENLNSILNRREIYCYIIEEIIGLKLPDYQFMKYINILRIPLLWLSIQQIFQLLYVPYICISIKKKKDIKHILHAGREKHKLWSTIIMHIIHMYKHEIKWLRWSRCEHTESKLKQWNIFETFEIHVIVSFFNGKIYPVLYYV